jgi:predicted membrane protein
MFEKSKYFNSMFPSLKIQKPGYDLYGSSTISLALLTIFVVTCYQHVTVDQKMFKFMTGQTSIFNGEMTMMVLFFITVIILERYTSRTDTKAVVEPKF